MANCTGALPSGFQHQDATKPPRNRGAYRQTDHDPYNVQKKMSNSDEFDNHTLSTASTSAATSSYSMTDDASEASEIGMEVSMSPREFVNEDAVDATPFTHHSFTAGKEIFSIDTRYKMIRTVGSGAYGTVISATDSKKDRKVAIKMIPRAFNDEIDAKRILREIKLMKHFQHDNIVGILDMMPPQSKFVEDFNDVYIVGELMETDLHRIIYSKQPLSIDHVQYFVYQILRGMKYIHSANVIHRDLKPSNLLVNANCDLKICDFGLARGILGDHQQRGEPLALTEYVVTRWYRAPEIMLACHEYSKPIDVWSIGCIFAELILRKPYFPGNDYIDQLNIISDKLGKIPEAEMDFVTSEKAKRFLRKLPDKLPLTLRQQFPGTPHAALDLLRNMLQIHPKKRITVEKALAHPFFAALSSPNDEPVAAQYFDFSFENENLHRTRLKEMIWKECGDFRPSCMPVAHRREQGLHEA